MEASSPLFSMNAAFIEGLYEDFLKDPDTVPPVWRTYFEGLTAAPGRTAPDRIHSDIRRAFVERSRQAGTGGYRVSGGLSAAAAEKQAGVLKLIQAYRRFGHLVADVDPIRLRPRPPVRVLELAEHNLSEDDLDTAFNSGTLQGPREATLRDIVSILRDAYTGHLCLEYTHLHDLEQRLWLQEQMERTRGRLDLEPETRTHMLKRLTAAEGLERYLHTRYAGQKRFSLEGGESLIPLMEEVIDRAGGHGVKEVAIGMAHRGRLNVLVNVMGKEPEELFAQFEGHYRGQDNVTGDVKYHEGFSSNAKTIGGPVHLALAFNPSHLEIIGPVVEGSVRCRQDRRGDKGRREVLPLVIHGDASIAGQGVVYETFNLAQTRGFTTGGTVRLVMNNQIGFTTSHPLDTRSTRYCTDIGRVIQAPIFHVNGDDPDAVVFAARLAADFRMRFNRDVLVDLVCYRRHGHNEADEPAATQPMMYANIRNHPTAREKYAQLLVDEGVVPVETPEEMIAAYRADLEGHRQVARLYDPEFSYPFISNWTSYTDRSWQEPADTTVALDTIRRLGEGINRVPEDLQLHPRVERIIAERQKMIAGGLPIDWGCAELLAYAALLDEGYPVRLTGQDSGRGTFFHRHAVWHNQRNGESYVPLQHLGKNQPRFTIIDSILSEEAVLAFEYGYATTDPDTLVIWEAQYGDFANGAQVVVDQFISSSEQKWRRLCGLVLMLPHGWEGQGPEHSSARLERYLQLCAEDNIQVCTPTTPAQMFHLLRRELLRPYRKPLVIMSPKSTLRRKMSFSSLEDLTDRGLQLVIDETEDLDPERIRRLVLCAGKVYYDVFEERARRGQEDVALIRIEQLYPFPAESLRTILDRYPGATDLIWTQEEPRNQGAWYSIQHDIRHCLRPGQHLDYAGRRPAAAPAGGDPRKHVERQKRLVDEALRLASTDEPSMLGPIPRTTTVTAK